MNDRLGGWAWGNRKWQTVWGARFLWTTVVLIGLAHRHRLESEEKGPGLTSMIAKVFSKVYDVTGRPVFRPSTRRYGHLAPNAPMGRHVTQPLTVVCSDLEDVRRFIQTCGYVSDEEHFGRRDYWMPPEEFERSRRGDCEDFALWTWRQLMLLGFSARFVCGRGGRYGAGHAWVTFDRDGQTFIVEALAAPLGPTFPRLSTLQYRPRISVSWDGKALRYFEHAQATSQLSFADVLPHIPEWVLFWARSRPRAWLNRIRRLLASLGATA